MADIAGNTIQTANTTAFSSIGPRPTRVVDRVGPTDRFDYYRLRLTGRTSVEITLNGLRDDANVQLVNRRGDILARSINSGTSDEAAGRTLNQGIFYIRVFTPNARANTPYRLNVSGYADNAGNTFNQTLQIDPQSGPVVQTDYVSTAADRSDFYEFDLTDVREVDLSLFGLASNTRLVLFDGDRRRIDFTAGGTSGTEAGPIKQILGPGTYFARVLPIGPDAATTYRFRAIASPAPDGAGDTFPEANNLGVLPERSAVTPIPTIEELLNVNDTDVYRFRTSDRADALLDVSLNLSNADLDVDLEIFDSNFQLVTSTVGSNTVALSDVSLAADSIYFIRVSKVDNAAFSFFTLDLETELDILDQAGNTPAAAFDINNEASWTPVNGSRSFNLGDFVGADVDEDDYYTFNLTEASFIDLNVIPESGDLNATADIQLFRQGPGGIGDLELLDTVRQLGNVPEQVEGIFDAGTYFIRVFPEAQSSFAFYDLSLEATSISLTPAFIKDIAPGAQSSSSLAQQMAGVGGSLFFSANDGSGQALWTTDGTFEGTQELRKFSTIGDMVAVNGFVYFTAADAALNNGQELWRTDGTAVELVRDILPGEDSSSISNFTVVGDLLYFTATNFEDNFDTNNEVWVVDTAFAGVNLANSATLLDVTGDNVGSSPSGLTAVGNSLYFLAEFEGTPQLFKSANGAAPTVIDTGNVNPLGSFVEFQGALYFTGSAPVIAGGTPNLFTLDANDALVEVDPLPTPIQAANFGNLTVAGGKLFFTASAEAGVELYAYDPTLNVGSRSYLVEDININPNISASSNPLQLTAVNDLLYFSADDSTGRHLWVSDGTGGGTEKLLFNGNPVATPTNLIAVGTTLYFTADGGSGSELWRLFPDSDVELVDIAGDVASNPGNLTVVNGRLFFRADTPEAGRELWVVGLPEEEQIL